jgi:hypothetical protein
VTTISIDASVPRLDLITKACAVLLCLLLQCKVISMVVAIGAMALALYFTLKITVFQVPNHVFCSLTQADCVQKLIFTLHNATDCLFADGHQ